MPESAAAFQSIRSTAVYQRTDLIERAWALPVAKLYRPLLSQSFTSVCGPTSVANVLRSMGVSSGKNPLRGFGLRAMSLDQLVNEAAEVLPAEWKVQALRPQTIDEFREELRASNLEDRRYVANFTRAPLFGGGVGHHSPVGGYLQDEDLAFVLDVNSSFGPWLVSVERFFEAVNTIAGPNGAMRGLARFTRAERSR